MESTQYLLSFLSAIPQVIVLVAVIMYVSRRSTPQGILMLIGAVLGLLLSLLYTIGFPLLAIQYHFDTTTYREYYTIAGWVGTLSGLCFSIGLLLLINNGLKRTERKV